MFTSSALINFSKKSELVIYIIIDVTILTYILLFYAEVT